MAPPAINLFQASANVVDGTGQFQLDAFPVVVCAESLLDPDNNAFCQCGEALDRLRREITEWVVRHRRQQLGKLSDPRWECPPTSDLANRVGQRYRVHDDIRRRFVHDRSLRRMHHHPLTQWVCRAAAGARCSRVSSCQRAQACRANANGDLSAMLGKISLQEDSASSLPQTGCAARGEYAATVR
jgi:hypothetical protein